jgi:hypothetical protein
MEIYGMVEANSIVKAALGEKFILEKSLEEFRKHNPVASIGDISEPAVAVAILNPWGDDTMALTLTGASAETITALNGVILAERYSGIWHRKTQRLEIAFTAFPLPSTYEDIPNRKFVFRHDKGEYKCGYGPSSEELLLIAARFVPKGPQGPTAYRSLPSFRNYIHQERPEHHKPLSFWIDGLPWDDDKVLEIITHINFYMTYFDAASPAIAVHSPQAESVTRQPQRRFAFDVFPTEIRSRQIDDSLLKFWEASRTGDPSRRFLYCYQIIENFAMTYIDDKIKKNVKKILAAPMANEFLEASTQKIIEYVSEFKMHDNIKIDTVLRETVDAEVIWQEIALNIDFFSAKCEFEGGLSVDAIAKPGWKAGDFAVSGMTSLSNTLRQIRNALSHAKDQRSMTVITPTRANMEKLQMWVPLASVAAGQLLVYGGLS